MLGGSVSSEDQRRLCRGRVANAARYAPSPGCNRKRTTATRVAYDRKNTKRQRSILKSIRRRLIATGDCLRWARCRPRNTAMGRQRVYDLRSGAAGSDHQPDGHSEASSPSVPADTWIRPQTSRRAWRCPLNGRDGRRGRIGNDGRFGSEWLAPLVRNTQLDGPARRARVGSPSTTGRSSSRSARRMGISARPEARLNQARKAHRQQADRVLQRKAARRVPEHP